MQNASYVVLELTSMPLRSLVASGGAVAFREAAGHTRHVVAGVDERVRHLLSLLSD
jgi:hypothetical protein